MIAVMLAWPVAATTTYATTPTERSTQDDDLASPQHLYHGGRQQGRHRDYHHDDQGCPG
jgi:hypothetical protein